MVSEQERVQVVQLPPSQTWRCAFLNYFRSLRKLRCAEHAALDKKLIYSCAIILMLITKKNATFV